MATATSSLVGEGRRLRHAGTETVAPRAWKPKRQRITHGWGFVAPVLVLHLGIVMVPAALGLYYSLTEWSGLDRPSFIGLDNYRRLFGDRSFRRAMVNNVKWMAFFLTVPFAMALFAAFLLSQVRRGGFAYRIVFFIPYVLPSVVVAAIWRNLLNPNDGLGAWLADRGVPGLETAFLGRSDTALWAIAFIDNWHYWGFLTVLFLTAMQAVDTELYESARLDGANRWRQFLHVTLPGIRPTVLFMLMMTSIWSFLVFDYVWILTEGGPAGSSEVMGTLVYKNAFRRFEAGYAAAQGVTISLFAGCIVLLFILLRRRGWEV